MSHVNQGESSGEIESMVGQEVTGFVEATLDDGYLLRVRNGDSNSYLRGVVFKPGHYVPVTEDNDIAPHVQKVAIQRDAMAPAKRKHVHRKNAASAPERSSSVAPAVSSSGGLQIPEHGVEEEVLVAEPLSISSHAQSIPISEDAHVGEEEKTE